MVLVIYVAVVWSCLSLLTLVVWNIVRSRVQTRSAPPTPRAAAATGSVPVDRAINGLGTVGAPSSPLSAVGATRLHDSR
jgi:hypothetical protein